MREQPGTSPTHCHSLADAPTTFHATLASTSGTPPGWLHRVTRVRQAVLSASHPTMSVVAKCLSCGSNDLSVSAKGCPVRAVCRRCATHNPFTTTPASAFIHLPCRRDVSSWASHVVVRQHGHSMLCNDFVSVCFGSREALVAPLALALCVRQRCVDLGTDTSPISERDIAFSIFLALHCLFAVRCACSTEDSGSSVQICSLDNTLPREVVGVPRDGEQRAPRYRLACLRDVPINAVRALRDSCPEVVACPHPAPVPITLSPACVVPMPVVPSQQTVPHDGETAAPALSDAPQKSSRSTDLRATTEPYLESAPLREVHSASVRAFATATSSTTDYQPLLAESFASGRQGRTVPSDSPKGRRHEYAGSEGDNGGGAAVSDLRCPPDACTVGGVGITAPVASHRSSATAWSCNGVPVSLLSPLTQPSSTINRLPRCVHAAVQQSSPTTASPFPAIGDQLTTTKPSHTPESQHRLLHTPGQPFVDWWECKPDGAVTELVRWLHTCSALWSSRRLTEARFLGKSAHYFAILRRRAPRLRNPWPQTAVLAPPFWASTSHKHEASAGGTWSHDAMPIWLPPHAFVDNPSGLSVKVDAWRSSFECLPHGAFLTLAAAAGFPVFSNITPQVRLHSNPKFSSRQRAEALAWFREEVDLGNMVIVPAAACGRNTPSPWSPHPHVPMLISSPLSVVPKPGTTKLRICHNLSACHSNGSVNSHTCYAPLEPLTLVSLDTFFQRLVFLHRLQPDTPLWGARLDLRQCYRQFPVMRRCWWKLAAHLDGVLYAHTAVIWGASAAAHCAGLVSNAIADIVALQHHRTTNPYLDDFIVAELSQQAALETVAALRSVLSQLHLAENIDKYVAPTQHLSVLGVQIDLATGTASVTPQRRTNLIAALLNLLHSPDRRIGERDLQSITGKLQFVASRIPFARARLFPLWRLLADGGAPNRHDRQLSRRLTSECIAAFRWFIEQLSDQSCCVHLWLGLSVHRPLYLLSGITTDASDIGFGAAVPSLQQYIMGTWRATETHIELGMSINARELMTIVFCCGTFATHFSGRVVHVQSDSLVSVCAISQLGSNQASLRFLVAVLCRIQETYRFVVTADHLPGISNRVADQLSRGVLPVEWTSDPTTLPRWTRAEVPKNLEIGLRSTLCRFSKRNRDHGITAVPDWDTGIDSVTLDLTSISPPSTRLTLPWLAVDL